MLCAALSMEYCTQNCVESSIFFDFFFCTPRKKNGEDFPLWLGHSIARVCIADRVYAKMAEFRIVFGCCCWCRINRMWSVSVGTSGKVVMKCVGGRVTVVRCQLPIDGAANKRHQSTSCKLIARPSPLFDDYRSESVYWARCARRDTD